MTGQIFFVKFDFCEIFQDPRKTNARTPARQTKLWVEPDIHTTQSEHYDMPLNNQQCFDFVAWSCAQSYILVDRVLILVPDLHR